MIIVRAICESPSILGYLRRLEDVDTLTRFKNMVDASLDAEPIAHDT